MKKTIIIGKELKSKKEVQMLHKREYKPENLVTYPLFPGHQNIDTSLESAIRIQQKAETLRDLCQTVLRFSKNGKTADEIAHSLDKSILSIRPRIAELKRMGLICDTGERRQNKSGHKAIVWKLK